MLTNHLDAQPRLAADSEEAEQLNDLTAGIWFDKEALNAMLAETEPHQVVCFVTSLCGEVHAGFSIIHDGQRTAFQMERFPLLEHGKALGEAIRMADEYEEGQ
jgi:hypothetical protein